VVVISREHEGKTELKGFFPDTPLQDVYDWVGIEDPIIISAKRYLELLKASKA